MLIRIGRVAHVVEAEAGEALEVLAGCYKEDGLRRDEPDHFLLKCKFQCDCKVLGATRTAG